MHQIEYEMQNDELKRAHLALEESRDRYLDLYDSAPRRYFSFTRGGQIIEVNLTGAALLGLPRSRLIRRGLGSFVVPEDRDRWERHLASVLGLEASAQGPNKKQSCELKLLRADGSNLPRPFGERPLRSTGGAGKAQGGRRTPSHPRGAE